MYKWSKPPSDIGPWYIEYTKNSCAKHDGTILVVDDRGKLLGFATLLANCWEDGNDEEMAHSWAFVFDLAVTLSARGQGVGKALLTACENIARDKGRKTLRLSVFAENENAIRAYQNFGFTSYRHSMEKDLA